MNLQVHKDTFKECWAEIQLGGNKCPVSNRKTTVNEVQLKPEIVTFNLNLARRFYLKKLYKNGT